VVAVAVLAVMLVQVVVQVAAVFLDLIQQQQFIYQQELTQLMLVLVVVVHKTNQQTVQVRLSVRLHGLLVVVVAVQT
jgi:hypothetical protein